MRALLGERQRRRDLLIEYLHLIQDKYGRLAAAHLAALAHEMKLALAEVYEVATFYAHFDVVKEGDQPPPPVTVRVCDSLSCAMAGAETLLREGNEAFARQDYAGAAALYEQAWARTTDPARVAFNLAYGASVPVFGEYSGKLQGDGETLSLIKPASTTNDMDNASAAGPDRPVRRRAIIPFFIVAILHPFPNIAAHIV